MSSFHPGGIHALFADGSSRFISQNIDTTTFMRLGSAAEGLIVVGE
jgi:prepilin-type processing-associated H-X9-DG protein